MTKLFQGKYYINKTITVGRYDEWLDERVPQGEWKEIVYLASWSALSIGVFQGGQLAEEHGEIVDDTWDIILTEEDGEYTSVASGTGIGKLFLEKYLKRCEVEAYCRECNKTIRGEEAVRNKCVCDACSEG